ncbi:MAG TPA: SGNH/GDSL hydrolase family protein [Gammaproteobacteria bacterium]|nr:SGNH/GDSL hydrolase family protein [Gammaproteobacteria bacterium]
MLAVNAVRRVVFLVVAAALVVLAPAFAASKKDENWVATWATALVIRPAPGTTGPAPAGPPPNAAGAPPPAAAGGPPRPPPGATVKDQTLRQIVHASIGGERVRVVLSNVFGTMPLEIGGAGIALRREGAAVEPASIKMLTFAGQPKAAVLAGATLVSDPVDLKIAPLSDLAIDLYIPGEIGVGISPATTHNGASQTSYVSMPGNHVGVVELPVDKTTGAWFALARVEVVAEKGTHAVVTFGDSITDGARSTVDANARWPDELARRLEQKGARVAVLNAGISGNRVLGDSAGVSALARFDRDVLMQTGVTHVIVLEGINDIGVARANASPSADDLIAAHRQLIARAHARGLKIYGATLTPFDGATYYTAEGEAKRQALNNWIRTGGEYDGVIDFDKLTRDPAAPSKFSAAADSGDHLHPGDTGYKAMGELVDLGLLK